MTGFVILLGLSSLFLIYLATESVVFIRRLKRVPIRITVSGTRGKTSIVRTLASVFRAHGIKILAKTTGSEAIYILPDGSLEKISRKGLTTILEQKRLINKAVKLDVKCIITEIMSIHPDNHKVETNNLIKPGLTILSNFRADHTDVVGESIREISELFMNDVFPGSKVIIPEEELNEFILKGIQQNQARLITANTGISDELNLPESVSQKHIPANLDAVVTASRYLGIPDENIIKGILDARLDIGQLEIFRFHTDNRNLWFVNAFAANDPVSTIQIIHKTREILAPEITGTPEIIALLALRSDRGERNRQWLDYLKSDGKDLFSRIWVSGLHAPIFTRKLENCKKFKSRNPEEITRQIIESAKGDILVFGIANIHGLGREMVEYWGTLHASSALPGNPSRCTPSPCHPRESGDLSRCTPSPCHPRESGDLLTQAELWQGTFSR
jgi:poly-gamma-glutamate synthase PgsB/CapB